MQAGFQIKNNRCFMRVYFISIYCYDKNNFEPLWRKYYDETCVATQWHINIFVKLVRIIFLGKSDAPLNDSLCFHDSINKKSVTASISQCLEEDGNSCTVTLHQWFPTSTSLRRPTEKNKICDIQWRTQNNLL